MEQQNISDEHLNAFVDNQLDSSERIQVFESIRRNDALKDRVCELSGLKEMIQHAYKSPPGLTQPTIKKRASWSKPMQAIAACLLLCIGGVSGWFSHTWTISEANPDIRDIVNAPLPTAAAENIRKVIVQVSNSNPYKLEATLDETENLLQSYNQSHHLIQVEVIANKHGVDLLRANVSNYKKRIALMQEKYPNLKFMVCGQTIGKLRQKGETITLLPHTTIATSAAEQINKRLNQGWGYIRI